MGIGMELGLKGKRVVVLASSRGLGKATAEQFAKEGAHVLVSSRSLEQVEKTVVDIKAVSGNEFVFGTVCNVTDDEQLKQLFTYAQDTLGGVDILINNTGGPSPGGFEAVSLDAWEEAFHKNLFSYVKAIRHVLPGMRENQFGRIINIASSSTKEVIDGLVLSNTFRLGIVGMTKTLAREVAEANILVNTVGPGRIQTDRITELDEITATKQGISMEQARKDMELLIPAGRYGEPEEFAKMIVFLCSEANTFTTGQSLVIDGGMLKAL